MLRIVTVVGARPQFIKAATVSRAILARPGEFEECIVHTGQHYDANMSQVFFDELDIPQPHVNLGIGGETHGAMTGRQMEGVEKILLARRPDWLLVYGDTDSTLAGALAAAKLQIPVAHVESGLRSFNRTMPEEINRVVTDHVADLLFTPTDTATSNLVAEGIDPSRIRQVGDVMYDAALFYSERGAPPSWWESLGLAEGSYVLCTVHRALNVEDAVRFGAILEGLALSGLPVILPAHPRTRRAHEQLANPGNLHVVDPVSYLEMVFLIRHSQVILTDSGGLQKEAYFHGRPCLTVREETEWVELLEVGANRLVAASPGTVARAIHEAAPIAEGRQLYGDGDAANRILDDLSDVRRCAVS